VNMSEIPNNLNIELHRDLELSNFRIAVESYWGNFADVYYFQVQILDTSSLDAIPQLGLLRVGNSDGALQKELELRQQLTQHRMIAPILVTNTVDQIRISLQTLTEDIFTQEVRDISFDFDTKDEFVELDQLLLDDDSQESEPEYLEEEYYDEHIKDIEINNGIVCLSYLPELETSLAVWLQQEKDLSTVLPVIIQFCQLVNYISQHGWSLVQINPKAIAAIKPIQIYDLTGAYKIAEMPKHGMVGAYCPPELAFGRQVDEQMGSYVIGALLYEAIHNQQPRVNENIPLEIKPIPGIYQILTACLAPNGDRPIVSQLLSLLVETQRSLNQTEIHWQVASKSTLGLSMSRWQNEDTCGVRQQSFGEKSESFILGIIADGMGGMEHGDVASKLALTTIMEANLPHHLSTNIRSMAQWSEWLLSLVQEANSCITRAVRNGGTTLSMVLAIGRELAIAHIGDSRIYLIRNSCICQLSEDHSLVAALLATEQITYAESQKHPDRNVLMRSLGSSGKFNTDQIQTLSIFGEGLSMRLENSDILLLCSDGIWDLVPPDELSEIFTTRQSLSLGVNRVIELVLARGAADNATILALECAITQQYK
jgi:PPM family protein phosphatase